MRAVYLADDVPSGRGEQCLSNRGQPLHFFKLRKLFLKPRLGELHRFRPLFSCGSLAVSRRVSTIPGVGPIGSSIQPAGSRHAHLI
jgi:hypothetical protein